MSQLEIEVERYSKKLIFENLLSIPTDPEVMNKIEKFSTLENLSSAST